MSARYRVDRSLRVLLVCSGLMVLKLGLCRFSPQPPGERLILLAMPPFRIETACFSSFRYASMVSISCHPVSQSRAGCRMRSASGISPSFVAQVTYCEVRPLGISSYNRFAGPGTLPGQPTRQIWLHKSHGWRTGRQSHLSVFQLFLWLARRTATTLTQSAEPLFRYA